MLEPTVENNESTFDKVSDNFEDLSTQTLICLAQALEVCSWNYNVGAIYVPCNDISLILLTLGISISHYLSQSEKKR